MAATVNIPALFEDVVRRVNERLDFEVFFDYGHYAEITDKLLSKGKSISHKGKRYPLIWLVMDFTERYSVGGDYYCELPDVQLILAHPTKQESYTPQRMQEVFIPILYPLYHEFLKQLVDSGHFHDLCPEAIPHEKIDRPYWGGGETPSKNGANLFDDYIDAIQLRRMRLFVNEPDARFKIFH